MSTELFNPLERREGETDLQYHKRLVYGKLVDKTLADYDYTELAEYVYGKSYSADVARRCMYGSKMTLDLVDDAKVNNVSGNEILDELENKKRELQKEKQKFQDQRREYNKLINAAGRDEHLRASLVDAANNLGDSVGCLFDYSVIGQDFSDNDAVLVLSDWHYGMTTDNIFNQYNTDICKERVTKIVENARQRIELHKCKNLHIVVLGDLIQGGIHCSARVASEEVVCDQLMQASEILAQAIMHLSYYVDNVHVHTTYGNHARTIQNKNDSIHSDNMERIVGWWLEARLADIDCITVHNDNDYEFVVLNVCGHWICGAHGDLDDVKHSPRLLPTLFNKRYGIDIDYILLGDKHHRESVDDLGVTAIMCGSLCGSDDYANDKRLYSTPSQLLLIMNEDAGVDAEYHLQC